MLHILKSALLLALVPAGVFCAYWFEGAGEASAAQPGRYVEARSASVFAGACHYNGEYMTQGREAVLCFQLGSVSADGVDLRGVEIVVALGADRNLEEADAVRRSVIYLDADLDQAHAQAARAWLEREHARELGSIVAVRRGDVRVSLDGGAYDVSALDAVHLQGAALPDRACCSMPSNVWYEPEVALAGRVVGNSSVFSIREPALQLDLSRQDENNAFVGCLAVPAGHPSCCSGAVPQS